MLGVAVLSVMVMLSGCGSEVGAAGESASPSEAPPATSPTPSEASPGPTSDTVERPTLEDISCDTMLDPLVDAALRATDLTPAPKPWTQFGFEPSGAAIECPWGYEGGNHSAAYFAWSAQSDDEAEQFLKVVEENGYATSEDEAGTWIVPSDDPNGVEGMLITDEWIAFAPTPELIPAIVWAR